ncbi:HPr-rel-A system PqqD family peptide chaperone [Allosphingosinicella indica]|uniref:PqqD family protein, HPr-rel-A system n=1 Tax=Allosphingosinicella indica TaxID=941907 RepID=A0A1X7H0Y4_9SPHN|nr:HPr-rel-A system PqqD family peptide chaperone [Allosphingosinicella indica]SMF77668.1 PqqD family protein, HPr-rel-A system [Allosphingosinicella indica]
MSGPVYRSDPADAVQVVPLDGLTLLFHRPSGLTHFLASPAPEILDALAEAPADASALADRLAARFDLGEGAVEALAARLGELEAAGLVQRA